MRIESALKHFSPKSLMITDSPGATASDSLTGTDVMAAIGMCESTARFGINAFMGKAGISQQDRENTVKELALYARKIAPKLISKAAGNRLGQCMLILAKFAYDDYARSAADTKRCPDCNGRGLTKALAKVMTHPGCGEPGTARHTPPNYQRQLVDNTCVTCHGKGVLSARCRCNGTGKVRDIEKSKMQGAPVEKDCGRCNARGFKRVPSSVAQAAIGKLIPELTQSTWSRNWKPFYEKLVAKCDIEESRADAAFSMITR